MACRVLCAPWRIAECVTPGTKSGLGADCRAIHTGMEAGMRSGVMVMRSGCQDAASQMNQCL